VSRLVPISGFLRGVSDSPRKKLTLAWLTFLCLACPAALLISLGVPQAIAISAMLAAILPFQYVAYSVLYGRREQKGQALTATRPPQTQVASSDALWFARAFRTQLSPLASLQAVTARFASLRAAASLQDATTTRALASLRATASLQDATTTRALASLRAAAFHTENTASALASLQATASLQAAATSALAYLREATESTALQAARASFAESALASLRVQRVLHDELSLAMVSRASGDYATAYRAFVEGSSAWLRVKVNMAEFARVATSAKSPAATYDHLERPEGVVRMQRSALIEARPVRRAGQLRVRNMSKRRQRSLVAA